MKNIKHIFRTLLFALVPGMLIMASCEDELIGSEIPNTPVNNFEYFWQSFNKKYGLFEPKNIDWQTIHEKYRPLVSAQTSDEQLYKVFCDMIIELNDNHVNLYPTNGQLPVFPGGILRYENGKVTILKSQDDYDIEVVKKYLSSFHEKSGSIRYGTLPGNIGYMNLTGHVESFKDTEKFLEDILHQLQNTKGIIIDVRGDYGGHDALAQYAAGRFANEKKLYMTTKKKDGASPTDFTSETQWYVEPTGNYQYTKPVVVMTSRFTQSAGETFTLAMKELDHVTVAGDTTAGSYSDNPTFELPNGWMFSLSIGDYRAADGKSYEGIGTSPDMYIRTTKEELLNGKDSALEKVIELFSK